MTRKIFPVFVLLLLTLVSGCTSLFFYPRKGLQENPALKGVEREDVLFKTPDGVALHGWLIKAAPPATVSSGTIVFLHGNAQNIASHVMGVLWLTREGFDLFAFDYRGYGRSGGAPTVEGVHIDAEAALKTVFEHTRTNKDRVFMFGQSLGGAVAVYAAANSAYRDRLRAVVIDSAFSGYRLIAREKLARIWLTWPFQYPLSYLFNDDYSPVKWIKRVSPVPVLIMHGTDDPVVPFHHGETLFREAGEPREFWKSDVKGHINSLSDERMRQRLLRYLKEAK